MKTAYRILFFQLLIIILGCNPKNEKPALKANPANPKTDTIKPEGEIQSGDIIFHTSLSNQSLAIQLATKSKYSHVGIIYAEGSDLMVYEAVQPIKLTPFNEWIKRGKDGHYVIKRLNNSGDILNPESISKMKAIGKKYLNKNYDLKFEWSDDKIYCSELVWKIYKEAFDIEIGQLEKIKDFDLSDEAVRQKLKERYGDNIPFEELVITPDRMFKSDKLVTVTEQ